MGAGIALVTRLPLWTAALWVAQEAARGRVPFGGFPWARLAFSQTASYDLALSGSGWLGPLAGAVTG
ncbi:hypothetical protein GCM10022214_03940 [Actinomadura miaoliensis]|uniref:Apolipoprotein N-acyltransferase N-terminal domain-containing protein n=1 Tax=Actinomadura miaoliensis TaxID=430685 RepID=A0ABP7UYV0_9ACTN